VYATVIGLPLGLLYLVSAAVSFLLGCWPQARALMSVAPAVVYPFGKVLVQRLPRRRKKTGASLKQSTTGGPRATSPLLPADSDEQVGGASRRFSWSRTVAPYLFRLTVALPLIVAHAIVGGMTWMGIVTIPLSKWHGVMIQVVWKNAATGELRIAGPSGPGDAPVLVALYQIGSWAYTRYAIFSGVNVAAFNASVVALAVIFFEYVPHIFHVNMWKPPAGVMFGASLIAILPLAYFIGMAIGSISVQSSPAVGAVLNASFGSIIDVFIFASAIAKGGLNDLVNGAVIGSIILCLLGLPGLSVFFGGLKHTVQRINHLAAGVSIILLYLSILGVFLPSVFYYIYGRHELLCYACDTAHGSAIDCQTCQYVQKAYHEDPVYVHGVVPLQMTCAITLPIAYIIGVFFTLKTHAKQLWNKETTGEDDSDGGEGGGHGGGHVTFAWSRTKSAAILLSATFVFALVAEALVNSADAAIKSTGLRQRFVGLTLIAIAPSATELISCVRFARRNQLALALEVGSSYLTQIALIQFPALVLYAYFTGNPNHFTLIFSGMDLFAVLISLLLFTFVLSTPRTNYFEGAVLVLCYLLIITAYLVVPRLATPLIFPGDSSTEL
jgi:Ca2+:H+ antiporter